MSSSPALFRWSAAAGLLALALSTAAGEPSLGGQPEAPRWSYREERRLPAAEARQGVAADADHLYAIDNYKIGKYRKTTGERVGGWAGADDGPVLHLNAGIMHENRLYCAHSNYPSVPMQSSVEIWDPSTMRHVASHSFGRTDGSLTWLDRRRDRWIACFVHYGKRGGEPGRGPEWTRLVEFDDEWRSTGGWSLSPALMARLGEKGYSVSGGAFGPEGFLYLTGHDHRELYVMAFPEAGSVLRWVATVPVAGQGQGFAWDPQEPDVLYMLSRDAREIIVGRMTASSPTQETND